MFDLIPLWAKYLLVGVVLSGIAATGWKAKAVLDERTALLVTVSAQAMQLTEATKVQAVTTTVLSSRVQSSAAIKTKAKDVEIEIIKRIPVDAGGCNLSGDWRLLHDAATAPAEVPTAPRGAADQTVTPQQAALTVTSNYAVCLDNADRLDKLQLWIGGISK